MSRLHQILTDGEGKPAFAVIPWREYKALGLDAMLSDEALYERSKAEAGEDLPPACDQTSCGWRAPNTRLQGAQGD